MQITVLRAICCGLYAVVEEVDPTGPAGTRTYVAELSEVASDPYFANAWKIFIGQYQ